jgi:myo-inositol catabolism protein IolH
MELAADTSLLRNYTIESALKSLSELGYRYVEVGLAHYFPHDTTDSETKEFSDAIDRSGLKLAALFGTYPISYPEEEMRQTGIQQYHNTIERARQLGCRLVVSELMGDANRYADCAKAFQKSVDELLPVLDSAGVTICFEAHPGDFTDKNETIVDLIKEVQSERVRYLYCVPHSFILGDDVGQMIDYGSRVLGYVHLADSLRPERTFFSGRYYPDVPPHQHLTLGKGDIDIPAVLSALEKAHYKGFLTIDPFSMFDRPLEAAADSLAFTRKLLPSTD